MTLVSAEPDATSPGHAARDGWGWFALATLSQAYLVFITALVAITLVPLIFGWQSSLVRSGSMEPHISVGDVVLTSAYDRQSMVPLGRVVTFRSGNSDTVTLHRIVRADDDGVLITAGDANADVDATPIRRDDILGLGRILVPFVGMPVISLTTEAFVPFGIWAALTGFAIFSVIFVNARRPTENDSASGTSSDSPVSQWTRRSLFAIAGGVAVMALNNDENPVGIDTTLRDAPRVTGFGPRDISGSTDRNNSVARNARADAQALYGDVDSYTPTARSGNLNGTVTPGVYSTGSGEFRIPSTLVLDAQGDSSARFVFTAQTLTAQPNSQVRLINGASADRVLWRMESGITLNQGSENQGTYLTNGNITAERDSRLVGRLISLNGSVNVTQIQASLPGR